jgi:hypothetical protein
VPRAPADAVAALAALYTAKPSASFSKVAFGEAIQKGVLMNQEFEFSLHVKDARGSPLVIDVTSHVNLTVTVQQASGSESHMPTTIREDKSVTGKYIVRTMCSNVASVDGEECTVMRVTVMIDGTVVGQTTRITAVSEFVQHCMCYLRCL